MFLIFSLTLTLVYAGDIKIDSFISYGEQFTIEKGQTAQVSGTDVSIFVKDFIVMECAVPGFNCGAAYSPPRVDYKILVDGKPIDHRYFDPIRRDVEHIFEVRVIESDYEKYATMRITRLYDMCSDLNTNRCWEGLAKKTMNLAYCDYISDENESHWCKERISDYINKAK